MIKISASPMWAEAAEKREQSELATLRIDMFQYIETYQYVVLH